ncbi:AIPR family protein [Ochrobactrum quorumnocens]|uniref:AIPR family protein n=1 Tax=Ochrobactrum quorumnocens TaxID=271865 RepID=A0A248UBE4_9HYPH|nr:AIPR family protein [[Ochrobactrum] quorumnocens]ASV83986.1 AIPR family protein [[Ochrobactrum] quorumnocens]
MRLSEELAEFNHEFFQDVLASADAEGQFTEDAFFDLFCKQLIDAGELDTADRALYQSTRGIRVDGYAGDPNSNEGELTLIIVDFSQASEIRSLSRAEMDAAFKRLTNFISKALDPTFRQGLEETSPGFGVADMIAKRWHTIEKIKFVLITNRQLSSRVEGRESSELRGIPVAYSVWDIARLHRFVSSGHGREEIEIDLREDFGGAIPALSAHLSEAGYEAYLLVIPGTTLAAIYERWGAQLLEQNVRVFLQARGSVNKGIRTTIERDPEMFFAFNNGITATAESVKVTQGGGTLAIASISNLQIVNGGQTTASIHAASRKKEPGLDKVFVQMKLSIVEPSMASDVVPKISEFANSQNKVNAADFFANHAFHIRFQEFSRRIFAPSPDGTFRESKWFYERARGQYQDARNLLKTAQKRKFDVEFPKSQMIDKTDLAKFLNPWRGFPEIVSRGSQKNFVHFADSIGKEWEKNSNAFNEDFFRHSIAKAIIFREAERLVTKQSWYQGGGIRSRVVPYAIAKLQFDAARIEGVVDLDKVWRRQGLTDVLERTLCSGLEAVHGVITGGPGEIANPLEWAKQQACWARVKTLQVSWPEDWEDTLVGRDEHRANRRSAVRDQKMLNGIEAQTEVLRRGGGFWSEVKAWGTRRKALSPDDASILAVAAGIPGRLPTERQCARLLQILQRLEADGFQTSAHA